MTSAANRTTCVIGAGCAGLAVLKALAERNLSVECFERTANVGGNWRYDDRPGASGAYASLRCNVSRRRMQYPSFPMPRSFGDFPHHAEMAVYLEAYMDAFGLRRHIQFSTAVQRIEPMDGGWRVHPSDGEVRQYGAVVVANGHHWDPVWPSLPGASTVRILHARDYRRPDPFAGQRVLVIGAGQSAIEIATELCRVAARTSVSVRSSVHVIPRYLLGRPFDRFDVTFSDRLPWTFVNWMLAKLAAISQRDEPGVYALGAPSHRVLEQIPIVSSDLYAALRRGAIAIRREVQRVDGSWVIFADGSAEEVDAVICATGYRISLPFLSPAVLEARGKELPLYRRIVPPGVPDLYLVGFVDPPGGLLPIVEMQAAWLAEVLDGYLSYPTRRPCGPRPTRRSAGRPNAFRSSLPTAFVAILTPTCGA